MCGPFTLRSSPKVIKELVLLHWGLIPFWADDPSIGNRMANAHSETAATKPTFRRAFRSRRWVDYDS